MKTTLQTIHNRFCQLEHSDNYAIGGGLDEDKFASRRHEDALNDPGKLTLGQATQLFKSATKLDINKIKEVFRMAAPNMEWHHAGNLPKAYGGGMKKTYFLNSRQICDIATNWDNYFKKVEITKIEEKNKAEKKQEKEQVLQEFLEKHATKIFRVSSQPKYFYLTEREMLGKYGWFDSSNKSYNLPEYYSGWEFKNKKTYTKFMAIKNHS